jgi:hypothetical protein
VLQSRQLDPVLWAFTMLVVTVVLFYMSGFLYSTVVLPALTVFLCQNLDLHKKWQAALFYALLAIMVINNSLQVAEFRDSLRALS